jgi:HrpA-like RNA helicase
MSLRGKIVEKIQENRVTLIVGETGCGKSSQVPQYLLEENMGPILCTQPRRFAVVAVARMVAKNRNCEVGGEIGYHIGHSKVLSARSNIVFKTAGVLLDEMLEKGVNALNYKVIILDEVHERSIESDLVLVCVKQFLLKKNDLRLVLMSATADIARYKEYFKELGRDERVEVLAIPSTGQHTILQRRVLYLDQITELLGTDSEEVSLQCYSDFSPAMVTADINHEMHKIIHALILHIHKNETDIQKSILVFLPTYYALEQQWFLLKPFASSFTIHILHSSIDTEQALQAMKISKSHRKVILATNIAESSVTIPQVAHVIDSCLSLQVYWDPYRKTDSSELVWVSKSQAEQRRGRTGRTCDGTVYRLITGSFYNKLQEHEPPAILRLSLRQQVLLICCAESRTINDPIGLMQKALDPPKAEVVEDAVRLLSKMSAIEKSARGRFEPTFYGRLLATFCLSFDASVLILKFAQMGMLREGIILGVLMDSQPLPIIRPFGQDNLFAEYTKSYYVGDRVSTGLNGKKEVLFMANLCAFQFWQRVFKDMYRVERLKHVLGHDETKEFPNLLTIMEEEWCLSHNVMRSSLQYIVGIYEDIINSLHRFRPKFLATADGLPSYYQPYEFQHACLLYCEQYGEFDSLAPDENINKGKCFSVPFADMDDFRMNEVSKNMATVIKEIRMQYAEDKPAESQLPEFEIREPSLCRFFMNGSCNKGSQCMFSHSVQAKRPPCKFFFSFQGCRNGESCFFSHNSDPSASSVSCSSSSSTIVQEDGDGDPISLLELFPTLHSGLILILDDNEFQFTSGIVPYYDPNFIITTTSLTSRIEVDHSINDVEIVWSLSHPYETIINEIRIPWKEIKCVLWFPEFSSEGENWEVQKNLLTTFFEYLAVRMCGDALYDIQVILTMNNIRFSQLQVEKLGRENFFFLKRSFPFAEKSFGKLSDTLTTRKPMLVSKAISYVFEFHPATDVQFGDYATMLRKILDKHESKD